MKTFLNVGMNDEIAEAFSQKEGHAWTAWDCYRRFFQSWGMVYGINRDLFDQVMQERKLKYGLELKIQFSPEQMKETCYSYEKVLNDHGIQIEKEPFKQLKHAILSVIDSWYAKSAVYYQKPPADRRRMGHGGGGSENGARQPVGRLRYGVWSLPTVRSTENQESTSTGTLPCAVRGRMSYRGL